MHLRCGNIQLAHTQSSSTTQTHKKTNKRTTTKPTTPTTTLSDNTTAKTGHFKGYAQLKAREPEHVLEALLRYGPIAVSIDASSDDFLFYAGGVFRDDRCKTKSADLDHAVLLVGYGMTPDGEEYYIVKNSWSKFWVSVNGEL
jgi:C1A family cysteine protease